MFLVYLNAEGKRVTMHLAGKPSVTFGRSPEADLLVADPKVSRIHAEIKPWDGDFVIKDLHSRNGTFVNGVRADVAVLKSGDVVRVGPVEYQVGREPEKGTRTIIREVTDEVDEGKKGYRTILREIVRSAETPPRNRKS